MKILSLIPARMGSSRFPGKPMKKILGIPMIEHVYKRVSLCKQLSKVAVATCDEEIFNHIKKIGGIAIMTSKTHERASDRCAEALQSIEFQDGHKYDIIVMVQGDEPMVYPDMITEALGPFYNNDNIMVTNLIGKISSDQEFKDRNCIKVVTDNNNNALYFSREPIPSTSKEANVPKGKQICIIPFRRDFLLKYLQMNETPLEIAESVDMMRILENGYKVKMIPTKFSSFAVDEEKDRVFVEEKLKIDKLHNEIFGKV